MNTCHERSPQVIVQDRLTEKYIIRYTPQYPGLVSEKSHCSILQECNWKRMEDILAKASATEDFSQQAERRPNLIQN